ncbi:ankyrin repeat domain-containing protein 50 [Coprinopsis cinerea AmutBmut pab1-1]|nr:ankyrin repeat domain-containing protein 50 [Coprinopsis cinerea AmutBmut pab1-1]
MYRQTVQRIQAQPAFQTDLGIRALLWVVFSRQALHIEDVLCAVAADAETHVVDEERMVDQESLISACCGLIEVDDFLRVRLVHYTAQEALPTILLEYYPQPHVMLVQVLMQRLISLGLPQSRVKGEWELELVLQPPLARYADNHWYSHYHHCKGISEVESAVFNFVKQCTSFPLRPWGPFSDLRTLSVMKFNPLHMAVFYDLAALIPRLVTVDGASPDGLYDVNSATDNDSITPLFLASWLGHVSIVEDLLVYRTIDPNMATKEGTVLVQVVRKAHCHDAGPCEGPCPTLARLLQIKNIQVNARDQWGKAALIYAVESSAVPFVEQLLQHPDIDVNARDNNGDTALVYAVRSRNLHLVRLLLAVDGIQVNAANRHGQTALIAAWKSGYHIDLVAEVVHELLNSYFLDVMVTDDRGDTALILATFSNLPDIVRRMLQSDSIRVNAANRIGHTALMVASYCGYKDITKDLLRLKGINVAAVDWEGNTAVHLASRWGHDDVVEQLSQVDEAVLNMTNAKGQTPIMIASSSGVPARCRHYSSRERWT